MMRAVRVLVSGKVQGVWYRDGTRAQAVKHGVSGWVRNLPDGRVEAFLQGDEIAVEHVLAWCRHGPPKAVVESVEVEDADAEDLHGFWVRH